MDDTVTLQCWQFCRRIHSFTAFWLIYLVGKLYWGNDDKLKRSWEIDLDSGRRIDLDGQGTMPEDEAYIETGRASIWRRIWSSL